MFRTVPVARLREIDASRVCLIKPSALGDVVQTLPLLTALRGRFPEAEIHWVINRELAELLECHPCLTGIIPFDRRGSWLQAARLAAELRAREFDLVLDLQGLLRTGLMTAATSAPVRVGLETAREGARLFANCTLPETGPAVPAHARYWRVAELLGVGDAPRAAEFVFSKGEHVWARKLLAGLRRPVLAIHPGARWVTKRWPVEKFAEIAARFAATFSGSVLVVGGPGEFQLAEVVAVSAAGRGISHNLAGRTTLKQLAALLAGADLLLSNDSGPLHLADAVGTPVVGLFSCTSPGLSGPRGAQHALLAADIACAASYYKTCPHSGTAHLACLVDLTTERIWQAVIQVLARQPAVHTA